MCRVIHRGWLRALSWHQTKLHAISLSVYSGYPLDHKTKYGDWRVKELVYDGSLGKSLEEL